MGRGQGLPRPVPFLGREELQAEPLVEWVAQWLVSADEIWIAGAGPTRERATRRTPSCSQLLRAHQSPGYRQTIARPKASGRRPAKVLQDT